MVPRPPRLTPLRDPLFALLGAVWKLASRGGQIDFLSEFLASQAQCPQVSGLLQMDNPPGTSPSGGRVHTDPRAIRGSVYFLIFCTVPCACPVCCFLKVDLGISWPSTLKVFWQPLNAVRTEARLLNFENETPSPVDAFVALPFPSLWVFF